MKFWQIALVAVVLGILSMFYQGLWKDPKAIPTVLIGTAGPEFSGPEVNSEEIISLSQYQGKVVMINFWASWCYECKVEHQNLIAIQKRYGDHPDFVLVGINYQDKPALAKKYLETYGNNFTHVRDKGGAISIDYGVYGVPETFIMDRQGIIRFKHVGPLVGALYSHVTQGVIEPLLQGQPISVLSL